MVTITTDEVRDLTGAPSSLITDSSISSLISSVESKTTSKYGFKFTPTKKIETLTGRWKDKLLVDEYFPLTVYNVVNGDTNVDVKDLYVHTEEGFIEYFGESLSNSSYIGYRTAFSGYDLDVKIKYLYGAIERDESIQTESTASFSSGNSVEVNVEDASNFQAGDWVFIEDLNQRKEVAKVESVDTGANTITFEKLVNDYQDESLITNSKDMEVLRQFILYETAVAVAINAIGSTYTFNTNYNLGNLSVNKGVPYSHWQESTSKNLNLRNELAERVKSMFSSIV